MTARQRHKAKDWLGSLLILRKGFKKSATYGRRALTWHTEHLDRLQPPIQFSSCSWDPIGEAPSAQHCPLQSVRPGLDGAAATLTEQHWSRKKEHKLITFY